MKTSALFLALALTAATAGAQQKPDYSRPTLLRILADAPSEKDERAIRFDNGAVVFDALGLRWSFPYHPVLPLPGSRPIVSQVLPDAFSLTGTEYATPPRLFRDELKTRGRIRINVRSQ